MSAQKSVRPWFNRHLFLGAAAWLLLTLPAVTVVAGGENKEAVAKVVRLNKEARQFFDAMEFSLAEKSLNKALDIGEAASLGGHVVMAGTHGNLAVLYASGLKNEDQAVFHFKKALELQPQYVPTAGTDSAEVKELFERAKSEMQNSSPAPSPEVSEPTPPPQGPLRCPTANMATAGSSLKLRCVGEGSLPATEVTVFFRAGESAPFKSRKMSDEPALDGTPGWSTQLPPEATSGEQLSLYFQARNKRGKVVASVGSVVEPVEIGIRGAGQGAGAASRGVRDDAEGEGETEGGPPKDHDYWWLGFGLGIGYGYAGSSGPEVYHATVVKYTPGVAWAKAAQITPEVGYFLTPSLSLSLQGRIQYIPQAAGNSTAPAAVAFLGRALYFTSGKTVRFYGSGILGGGQGFRLYVEGLKRKPNNTPNPVNDTVLGGPVVFGVGGGMAVGLSDSWSWILEINGLGGVPAFSMVADINTGVRLRL
jgi:hypothetical protein